MPSCTQHSGMNIRGGVEKINKINKNWKMSVQVLSLFQSLSFHVLLLSLSLISPCRLVRCGCSYIELSLCTNNPNDLLDSWNHRFVLEEDPHTVTKEEIWKTSLERKEKGHQQHPSKKRKKQQQSNWNSATCILFSYKYIYPFVFVSLFPFGALSLLQTSTVRKVLDFVWWCYSFVLPRNRVIFSV